MAATLNVFHVVSDDEGKSWRVTQEGDNSAPEQFRTKEEAVEAGKKLAQAHGPSQLRVYDTQGNIDYEQAYEADPLLQQLEKFGF